MKDVGACWCAGRCRGVPMCARSDSREGCNMSSSEHLLLPIKTAEVQFFSPRLCPRVFIRHIIVGTLKVLARKSLRVLVETIA